MKLIKFDYYQIINESKKNQREYNNILDQLGVVDSDGRVDLSKMTNKIDLFFKKDKNKKKFFENIEEINIGGKKTKIKAKKLIPIQSDIYLDKSIESMLENPKFIKDIMKKGIVGRKYKNISNDFLISSDNYIIDGNHRWCSVFMLDPECEIKCIKINLPMKTALPILNAILKEESKSKIEDGGNVYKHNLKKFIHNKNLPEKLTKLFGKYDDKDISKLIKKIEKIDDDPIIYLCKNIQKISLNKRGVDRKDMPQLKNKIKDIIKKY